MTRTFTEVYKEYLLKCIDEVESQEWTELFDWSQITQGAATAGDLFLSASAMILFHDQVLEKNRHSKEEIEQIFENVWAHADRYTTRFAAVQQSISTLAQGIQTFAGVFEGGRPFDAAYARAALLEPLTEMSTQLALSRKLFKYGLDEEDLGVLLEEDSAGAAEFLSSLAAILISAMPNVKETMKMEVPIGKDLWVYYSVTNTVKGGDLVTISTAVEEERLVFKEYKINKIDLTMLTDEGIPLFKDNEEDQKKGEEKSDTEAGGISAGVITISDDDFQMIGKDKCCTLKFEDGLEITFTLKAGSVAKQDWSMEEKVTKKTDYGSVSTAFGIKHKESDWEMLKPKPCPEFAVNTVTLPDVSEEFASVFSRVTAGELFGTALFFTVIESLSSLAFLFF